MIQILILILSLFTQTSAEEISFGNGGGFTGAVNAFVLTREGDLFSENAFTNERTVIKKIDTTTATEIFQFTNSKEFQDFQLNIPGNTYKYVYFNINGTQQKFVWTGKSENKSLNLLYTQLMGLSQSKE